MTNKEAIEILEELPDRIVSMLMPLDIDFDYKEALKVAIKALERDGSLSYDEVITSGFACPVCGAIWRDKEEEE